MKRPPAPALALALLIGFAAGCARIHIRQSESKDGTRTTEFRATTFFDSKNELAKARTTMTDKSQGVGVEGIKSEADSEGAQRIISSVVSAAVKAAAGVAAP